MTYGGDVEDRNIFTFFYGDDDATVKTIELDYDGNEIDCNGNDATMGYDEETAGFSGGSSFGGGGAGLSSTSSTPRTIRARQRQQYLQRHGLLGGGTTATCMDRYLGCITTRAKSEYPVRCYCNNVNMSNSSGSISRSHHNLHQHTQQHCTSNKCGMDMGRVVVLVNVTNIISLITAMTVFCIYSMQTTGSGSSEQQLQDSSEDYSYNQGSNGHQRDGSWMLRAWFGLGASLCMAIFGVYGGIFVGRGTFLLTNNGGDSVQSGIRAMNNKQTLYLVCGSTMIGISWIWYTCVCLGLLYYLLWWTSNSAYVSLQFTIFTSLSIFWSCICISPHLLYFVSLYFKYQRIYRQQQTRSTSSSAATTTTVVEPAAPPALATTTTPASLPATNARSPSTDVDQQQRHQDDEEGQEVGKTSRHSDNNSTDNETDDNNSEEGEEVHE